MKFRGYKALRAEFPEGSIVQVRLLTKQDNWVEVEGPISEPDARLLLRLAIGPIGSKAEEKELPHEP